MKQVLLLIACALLFICGKSALINPPEKKKVMCPFITDLKKNGLKGEVKSVTTIHDTISESIRNWLRLDEVPKSTQYYNEDGFLTFDCIDSVRDWTKYSYDNQTNFLWTVISVKSLYIQPHHLKFYYEYSYTYETDSKGIITGHVRFDDKTTIKIIYKTTYDPQSNTYIDWIQYKQTPSYTDTDHVIYRYDTNNRLLEHSYYEGFDSTMNEYRDLYSYTPDGLLSHKFQIEQQDTFDLLHYFYDKNNNLIGDSIRSEDGSGYELHEQFSDFDSAGNWRKAEHYYGDWVYAREFRKIEYYK